MGARLEQPSASGGAADDLPVTQSEEPSTPCGPCRQLMWEYCGDIDVTLANLVGQKIEYKLATLFPHPFYFCIE